MTSSEPEPLRIGNRYRLEERIGVGAMGAVWRGTDELLNRAVAVKELIAAAPSPAGAAGSEHLLEESRQRILREGRIGARLQHAHVISMFDVVVHDDRPWLVMEYLPSRSLAALLTEKGPMTPQETAEMGRQVADGLAAAHAAGVVHRDVKPGNVLIAEDGRVKITDFGVSRAVDDVQLTRTGMIAGTPAFLAPEIARGQDPTTASDVFALGATLYTAVEGEPPFGLDDNAYALLHKVATGHVRPPEHAGPLTALLMRLLENDPDQRPTAAQARDALTVIAAGKPVSLAGAPAGKGSGTAILPFASSSGEPADPPSTAAGAGPAEPQGGTLTDVPPVPPTEAAPPVAAPQGPGGRNRGRKWLPVLLVVLALAVVGAGVYIGAQRAGNHEQPPAAAPSTAPPISAAPTPTSAAPTTTTAPSTSSTPPTSTSSAGPVSGQQAVAVVQQYYGLLPENTEAAFAMLGPQAQSASGGYSAFADFYGRLSNVWAENLRTTGDGRVTATIVFTRSDGSTSREGYSFQVAPDGNGRLLIQSFSRG